MSETAKFCIRILPTDQLFLVSPQEGDPDCLCSRCGGWIPEETIALRCFYPSADGEYRYCDYCQEKDFGMWGHDHLPTIDQATGEQHDVCAECRMPIALVEGRWKISGPCLAPGALQ